MSRYFATITVPIHAKTDKKAFEKANKIRKSIEVHYDHTELKSIVQNKFGSITKKELKLTDFIF
jgi:hypothetical protein